MFRSIVEAVQRNAREHPMCLAAADIRKAYTYRELHQIVLKVAQTLDDMSVDPGDVILAECTQNVDFLILDLACEWTGAVFVPFEQEMNEIQVRSLVSETQAKYVIAETLYEIDGYQRQQVLLKQAEDQQIQETQWEEKNSVAEILFTTGTTGKPKGIMISHRANVAIAENIKYGTQMCSHTVEMVPLPLNHSHGLRTCYANFLNGSAVVIFDGVRNISAFFEMFEKYHVTALDLSPTFAKVLLKIARRGLIKYRDQMEYIEIGTSFLDDSLKQALREIFATTRLYNFYGSTESGRSCVLEFSRSDATGCVGYPSRNATFRIVDEDHRPIKSSNKTPGLLAVSGKMMMDGYFGSEELTKTVLKDGILYTSDLGYIDEDGKVYVLGRKDDVINYKGIKIAPEEIETAAMKSGEVLDCACVPVQDELRGQVPKLYLVPGPAYDEKRLAAFLYKILGAAKMPLYMEMTDSIPRSPNGKILRKKLREGKQQIHE